VLFLNSQLKAEEPANFRDMIKIFDVYTILTFICSSKKNE